MKMRKLQKTKLDRTTRAAATAAWFESLEIRTLMSTYYLSPSGSDSAAGSSGAPFASFNKAYTVMHGGDTLIVKDGTYNQQTVISSNVRPPSGSASAYTVVKAETPGGVVVDGKGNMSPLYLNGAPASPLSYVQIDGIVFRHQSAGAQLYQVDHIKLTRDGFEDGGSGNTMTFNLHKFCSYVLVEDCFAWGSGRYKFSTYHADHIIFRRCVARQDRHDANGEPLAVFTIYATDSCEVQNCIAIDGDHPEQWISPSEYGGCFSVSSTDGPSTNVSFTGNIALNTDLCFTVLAKNLTNITFKDNVAWDIREGGWLRDWASFDHMTIGTLTGPARSTVNSDGVGMRFEWGDDPQNKNSMTNSILTGIKGTALWQFASEDYNDFYGNNVNRGGGTPTGSHSVTTNPALKYILRSSDSAVPNMGANIIYQMGTSGTLYGESGYNTLSNIPLWPWPNEEVIGNFMRSYSYGSLSGNRGFAATGQTLTNYIWTYLGNANPYTNSGNPTAPIAPSALNASATSATQINLSWSDNSTNETGFILERQTGGGAWAQIATPAAGATSYSDSGLTASTAYSYRIKATNSVGDSSYSSTASATTQATPTAPAAPSALNTSAGSATSVTLTWTDNANNETGFLIERQTGSGSFSQIGTAGAGVVNYTDTTAVASMQYTYRVRSTNSVGNSAYSNTSTVTTPVAAPTAPSGLTATAGSSTSVSITWTDNANNETGYLLERKTGSGSYTQIASLAADAVSYSDSGLAANTQYTYRVRATNAGGNSGYSNTSAVTTPPGAPAAPSNLAAVASSATKVVLTWNDNAGNETGFLIERKTGTGSYSQIATVGQGVQTYNDTTTAANTQYTYRVRATNAAGNSAYSNTSAVTTPQTPPTAPGNLDAVAAGPNQVDLVWDDNSTNETNFLIERQTSGGAFTQIASVGANVASYSDTTVAPGTDYVYRVRATNSAGNSVFSAGASVTTPQVVITPPSALSATLNGAAQADLTWTDNSGNETGFLIERKIGTGSYTQIASVGAGETSYSDSGLATDTRYTYRVCATDGSVNSGYSNTDTFTTPQTLPAVPSDLSASASDASQVDLTWTDNSSNESGFIIERKTGSGSFVQIASLGAGVTSYGDTTVSSNTAYQYRVHATNTAGDSADSNLASVTTPEVTPGAPSDLSVAISDPTQVVLVWTDNSNNESGFIVERQIDGSYVPVATVGAGITTYADTGLTADTDYSYRVRALSSAGSSDYSNTVTAHTAAPLDLAGNTIDSARTIGSLNPGVVKVAEETIGTSGDRYDLYRVDLVTTTTVNVKLLDMIGNADLQILDADGNRLAYAKHAGSVDEQLIKTLSAGTYYVRVLCTSGEQTSYRLRVETALPSVGATNPLAGATNLGAIGIGDVKAVDGQISIADRNDHYRVTLDQTTRLSINLSNLTDDADLMVLNSSGKRVAYAKNTGSASEALSLKLTAGTYYVRVMFTKGISSTAYRLRLAGLAA